MENDFKIGSIVQNIDPRLSPSSRKGQTATVIENDGYIVVVEYSDGGTGSSNLPYKYYRVIDPGRSGSGSTNYQPKEKTSMTQSIVNFVRNLTLTAGEKLMRKHGLKTECGTYSMTAQQLVLEKLTAENEAFLIEMAEKFEAEEKANKDA